MGFAVAVMVFTCMTLSIADAIIKVTITNMPLAQLVFLRSCFTLPLLVAIMRWCFPRASLKPARPGWAMLRSALLLASLLLYYASLPRLDLSVAAAVYYTIPLFITLFASIGIRETVGPMGWIGVAIFADNSGREAHFAGQVAGLLNEKASELISGGWDDGVVANVHNFEILATK